MTETNINRRSSEVHGAPRTVRDAAHEYLGRGWRPVPLRRREKKPRDQDWQTLDFEWRDIRRHFSEDDNVGVQLGPRSGGLTDVDLDTPEACALAGYFLPDTGAVFGRRSTPRSHRLYRTDLADTEQRAVVRFQEPSSLGSKTLLELRIGGGDKGAQTMVPPSRHPDGELVRWDHEGDPAQVDGGELKHRATELAAATLLARQYPGGGSRHEAALVLGGLMARAGATADQIALFVEHVARAAGDEEARERGVSASGAVSLREEGGNVPGLPRMREVWGDAVADTVAKWLEIPTEGSASVAVGVGDATQVETLLALARDAVLFHTEEKTAFADIEFDDHREIWPVRSSTFRQWLQLRYYNATHSAPSREAMTTAVSTLEAKALFEGACRRVHTRTASHKGRLYIDLCDDKWRAIELDERGWRIVDVPPVRFIRARGMLSLPTPVRGGSVHDLRRFLNVKSDDDFVLLVSWMLAALRDRGPYPILVIRGEEGTGKSTLVNCVRALVDPNKVPLRSLPRDERDLYIAAANGYVFAFDNVSTLSPWLSDGLCRLSTGGGFATRQLYTDQDELLITASRAAILNGIEDFVTRSDLADRSIFLSLTPIASRERRNEEELKAGFEAKRPAIFGALLDAMVHGLRHLQTVRMESAPRMADFAKWAIACEGAIFEEGSFADAYSRNRRRAVGDVIEADPIASAIVSFMRREAEWEGRSAELLAELERIVGERVARSKAWPDTPRGLRARLQRVQAPLRRCGVTLSFAQGHIIRLVNTQPQGRR